MGGGGPEPRMGKTPTPPPLWRADSGRVIVSSVLGRIDGWRSSEQAMTDKKIIRCECGKRLKVEASLAGRRAQCPFCKKMFFVPKPEKDPFAGLAADASIMMFWPKRSGGDGPDKLA